jgi:hypothetical protein
MCSANSSVVPDDQNCSLYTTVGISRLSLFAMTYIGYLIQLSNLQLLIDTLWARTCCTMQLTPGLFSLQDYGLDVEAFSEMVQGCPRHILELSANCCLVSGLEGGSVREKTERGWETMLESECESMSQKMRDLSRDSLRRALTDKHSSFLGVLLKVIKVWANICSVYYECDLSLPVFQCVAL